MKIQERIKIHEDLLEKAKLGKIKYETLLKDIEKKIIYHSGAIKNLKEKDA